MESVHPAVKVATWLELAVAPEWRRQNCKVRVHALSDRAGGCYAISMDERWLCTGDGRLTVFKGLDAALRFLKVVHVEDFEAVDVPAQPMECMGQSFCLCVGRDDHLGPCPANCVLQRLDA
ncbi:hypothetical protein E6C76_05550 [Pseudothauera nasutitermitis]|uniref:Uncharacterized protein n=1 Tax=Pseudothauera nasutitermitis TaxID=2565930 RepID=A0A4V3WC96_9RHOO|nr:hypothetical protein [Pseudothauera nasutitermitis]THF66308.1 hypothetical protein E6C76_05550 [Pseudothauera nasutitermitis]